MSVGRMGTLGGQTGPVAGLKMNSWYTVDPRSARMTASALTCCTAQKPSSRTKMSPSPSRMGRRPLELISALCVFRSALESLEPGDTRVKKALWGTGFVS